MSLVQFRLDTFATVRGRSINIREEHHGEEKVPAIDWAVEMDVPNTFLKDFAPELLPMFYKPAEGQPQLEGVEEVMPLLRSHDLEMPMKLNLEYTGYQLTVDSGLGDDKSNITLLECRVNKFTLDLKEGGSIVLRFRIQAAHVDERARGRISSYIRGAETAICLSQPKQRQQAIDGSQKAFDKDHPHAAENFELKTGGAAAPTPSPTGHEAGDEFAKNEKAGKNKPAAEVPAAPKKKRGSVNKPSLAAH